MKKVTSNVARAMENASVTTQTAGQIVREYISNEKVGGRWYKMTADGSDGWKVVDWETSRRGYCRTTGEEQTY